MGVPNPIANGDNPDGDKLQENLEYLEAGKGVKTGTLQELKTFAALTPTVPFICKTTTTIYMYMGDIAVGDNGFIPLGGTGAGPVSDIDSIERG